MAEAQVTTSDGVQLGRVKRVEGNAFLIDAPKQFDYWLEVSLVDSSTPEQVTLTFAEAELSGYKMDRPNDHNGFREPLVHDIRSVQADALLRGQGKRS